MKVLIADKFEKSGLDGLKAAGCDVIYQPDASGDSLVQALAQSAAPVLVVRSTQVTDAMLDAGALALIVRAGAGVNTIDVAGASRRGIYVSNCPGKNSVAVAELTLGLILALDRRIPDNVAELLKAQIHDRMTEMVFDDLNDAQKLYHTATPAPLECIVIGRIERSFATL